MLGFLVFRHAVASAIASENAHRTNSIRTERPASSSWRYHIDVPGRTNATLQRRDTLADPSRRSASPLPRRGGNRAQWAVMEQITIRPARPEDARGIAELDVETWRTTYAGVLLRPTWSGCRSAAARPGGAA